MKVYRSFLKGNKNGRHVIHSILPGGIFSNELIKELLQNLGRLLFLIQFLGDPLDHILVGLDLPDAIAAHDDEIDVLVLYFYDVGVGRYDLLFGGDLRVALIL